MFMLLLFEWLPRSEVLVASLVPLVLISLSFHHILVIRLRCKQVESIENGCVILALSFLGYLTVMSLEVVCMACPVAL